jgi:hypothetical protein
MTETANPAGDVPDVDGTPDGGTSTTTTADTSTPTSSSGGDVSGNDGSPDGGTSTTTAADASTPTPAQSTADLVSQILSGVHKIADVAEAAAYVAGDAGEAVLGAIEPVNVILLAIELFTQVIKATETEEHGCKMRGWCYAALYGALNMGTPPEPTFQGSLAGPEQDQLDQQWWDQGVAEGQQDLANGTNGVTLSNKLLLRVAYDGNNPATTLNGLWQACCAQSEVDGQQLAAAYPSLNWPQPTGA